MGEAIELIYPFCNSVENSIMQIGMLWKQKTTTLETWRN